MASEGFHESTEDLTSQTLDLHRAIRSLMEELEAIDWYQQRVDATKDDALRAILAHNRDEEKEHASMLLEWIRRQDPACLFPNLKCFGYNGGFWRGLCHGYSAAERS